MAQISGAGRVADVFKLHLVSPKKSSFHHTTLHCTTFTSTRSTRSQLLHTYILAFLSHQLGATSYPKYLADTDRTIRPLSFHGSGPHSFFLAFPSFLTLVSHICPVTPWHDAIYCKTPCHLLNSSLIGKLQSSNKTHTILKQLSHPGRCRHTPSLFVPWPDHTH